MGVFVQFSWVKISELKFNRFLHFYKNKWCIMNDEKLGENFVKGAEILQLCISTFLWCLISFSFEIWNLQPWKARNNLGYRELTQGWHWVLYRTIKNYNLWTNFRRKDDFLVYLVNNSSIYMNKCIFFVVVGFDSCWSVS